MPSAESTPSRSGSGRSGRPPRTSRDEILAAARRIIDRDGWETLSVRRLASELEIGPATVYHHVRDRQDLLIQLLTQQAAQLGRPDLPAEPRERIVVAARQMHDALAEWPWAAEVLTTDGFLGRLGEPALWLVDAIVAGAIESGCSPEQAVAAFRSIWYYTVGEILVRAETDRRPSPPGPAAGDGGFFRDLDPAAMPGLAAIGDRWPALAARDSFEDGLRGIVDGLIRTLS